MEEKKNISLYERLSKYASDGTYPFHMPGHKRRCGVMGNPYSFDITEIDGFDDLHHPSGILKEAQERAAALYGSEETFFLVNGSTAGILTAISAAVSGFRTRAGAAAEDALIRPLFLAARNCHRSVYHALYLNRADVKYLLPENIMPAPALLTAGGIRAEDVKKELGRLPADSGLCGIVITSPTYEGAVSDISKIAEAAHERGAMLIVDEAHGAHFGLDPSLPKSAVSCGADLVIQSMHKTLPSLTQTALLHVNGPLADRDKIRRFLKIYQTSSPSYVLMAGMDQCIRGLEKDRKQMILSWNERLKAFYSRCDSLSVMSAVYIDDPGRILISADGRLSGTQICDILRNRFRLEPEMAGDTYAVCISTMADVQEGFDRLFHALETMDRELIRDGDAAPAAAPAKTRVIKIREKIKDLPEAKLMICEAWDAPSEILPLQKSIGRVASDFVYLYPPGIPLLVPGERITKDLAVKISDYYAEGRSLQGIETAADEAMVRVISGCRSADETL